MPVVVGAGDRLILANGSLSSLAKPSVPFSLFSGASGVSLSGNQVASYQQIYERQQWVATAVNKLSRQIASLPLNVYRLTDEDTGARERVRNHPLADLLHRPRERRGSMYLKQALAWPALLHGNALLAKGVESQGAPPSSLIPLDWRFVTPHFLDEEQGEVGYWQVSRGGRTLYLDASAVVHMAWQAGRGDIGVSPLEHLADTVSVENSAIRYQAASFNNGVRHSSAYILPPDVDLDAEERAELRASINATQGGVDRAFQMALVSGGGDIKSLSHSAVEAALIEQRKLNREEIAAVYDIPPPLIGILDKATYSNISVQAKMLYGMVLGPWLGLIKETIETQLIAPYKPWADEGLFVDFDLSEVLKGEPLAEIQAIAAAIGTGVMTPNEGRQARNLPPSKDSEADKLHMPTNNMEPMGGDLPVSPPVKSVEGHVDRARHLFKTRRAAGHEKPWDRPRFVRELTQDVPEADAEAIADGLESDFFA